MKMTLNPDPAIPETGDVDYNLILPEGLDASSVPLHYQQMDVYIEDLPEPSDPLTKLNIVKQAEHQYVMVAHVHTGSQKKMYMSQMFTDDVSKKKETFTDLWWFIYILQMVHPGGDLLWYNLSDFPDEYMKELIKEMTMDYIFKDSTKV